MTQGSQSDSGRARAHAHYQEATELAAALRCTTIDAGPYWALLAAVLLAYAVCTHLAKVWFVKRWGL